MDKQRQQVNTTRCKWFYASMTLVGVLLVAQPVYADTQSTSDSASDTATATVTAATTQTAPSVTTTTTRSSTATSQATTVQASSQQASKPTVTTAVQPDKLAVGGSAQTRQTRKTPTYALRHQFLRQSTATINRTAVTPDATTEPVTPATPITTPAVTPVTPAETVTPTVTDSLTYQLNDAGSGYIVTGLQPAATTPTAITIPDYYLGKPVAVIGAGAFKNAGLTAVTLGENLQWIETDAFANNKSQIARTS